LDQEPEPWVDPPNCPECIAEGVAVQPLVKKDGRWWCRRQQAFIELEEVAE
jgi:hypothetical protein